MSQNGQVECVSILCASLDRNDSFTKFFFSFKFQWNTEIQGVAEMEHNAIKMLIPDSSLADYPNTIIVQTTENVEIENVQDQVAAAVFGKRKRGADNDEESKKSKLERDAQKEYKRDRFIETVMAYRCRLCVSFLAMDIRDVENHLMSQHEADYFDASDWLEVAQKEDIRLECPIADCQNLFEKERSFKTHLIDDHNFPEDEVGQCFQSQNALRKSKALAVIREQKEAMKIKRSALDNREMEAYVDEKGDLRVRTIKSNEDGTDSDEDIDVTADKYFQVVKESQRIDPDDEVHNSATDVKISHIEKTDSVENQTRKKPTVLSKLGRPKGSKSVGLSKLKQLNPKITMSEHLFGTPCNRGRCGVRLSDPEKLLYHREKCHDPVSNDYICPECQKDGQPFSGTWARVAMHLWRAHQIDLELLKCVHCTQFRAFNRARYEDHMSKHKSARPYKCTQENCAKSFKQERHLKDHVVRTHQQRYAEQEKGHVFTAKRNHPCRICSKEFKTQKNLQQHVNSIHEGLKPFSCRFCDYSSANKSNLTTHGKFKSILRIFTIITLYVFFPERQHTGHKPYSCQYCDYRATDKNSLTKHIFKHTGEKRFFCRLCDFGTIQLVNLGYHYKTVHLQEALKSGYLFTCKLCKYFTIREDSFNTHMSRQHGETWTVESKANENI